MIKRLTACVLSASLLSGCATAAGPRLQRVGRTAQDAQGQATDKALLAEYAQKLPLGTNVKVDRVNGGAIKGTLMKATDDVIVVQRRTRIPEPPDEIPLGQIVAITPQAGNGGIGKAIGIGVAAGAGAALAVILILIAAYSD